MESATGRWGRRTVSGPTRRQQIELLYGKPDPWQVAADEGALRAAQVMLFGGICQGDNFIVQHACMKLERLGGRDMEGHRCGLCSKNSDEQGEPVYAYGDAVTSMNMKSGWYHNSCVRAKRVEYDATVHEARVRAKKEEKVAGLVVDATGKKVKLHTTDTMDSRTGEEKVAPYKGRPFNNDPGSSATEAVVARPKVSRGVVARRDDDLVALSGPEVIAKAKEMGYQEPPVWPNGGVRVMRARNYIRNAWKKAMTPRSELKQALKKAGGEK